MSATPFDHPLLSGLLGDAEVAAYFEPAAEIDAMIRFERELAVAQAAEGVIPPDAARHIARHIDAFRPDLAALARGAERDGVVGPEFVRQLRAFLGEQGRFAHFGATSQDAVDTALVLRLRPILDLLGARLDAVTAALATLASAQGSHRLMGRTRMQDAMPITVGDKIATWSAPLARDRARLAELRPRLLVLQFGGAVGTRDGLDGKGAAIAQRLAEALGLGVAESWQAQRDNLAELAGWLALVTGSLGKIGVDVALLAQMRDVHIAGSGGSSAMPHKQNPVMAEVLVALARHNATLIGGMHQAMLHEQERSGSAWTLEWLTLPQMIVPAAASLRTAVALIGSVVRIGDKA